MNTVIPVRSMFNLPVMEEEPGHCYIFYSKQPVDTEVSPKEHELHYHRRCVALSEDSPFKDLPFEAMLVVMTTHGADEVMVFQPQRVSSH